MSELERYIQLKKKVEQAQQKADKVDGALGQMMKQLKGKFGCSSLEEAKKKLKVLKGREDKTKREFDKAVEAFEEEWEDKL